MSDTKFITTRLNELASAAGRRDFLKNASFAVGGTLLAAAAGAQVASAAASAEPESAAPGAALALSEKEKLAQIATNTYPLRPLFKRRAGGAGGGAMGGGNAAQAERTAAMKKKYGEITLLDFPQFTKDRFPGVTHMDVWSSLFGDVDDDSMYVESSSSVDGTARTFREFDPSTPSSKKWLEQFANNCAKTGVKCHHVSNNAPRNIADLDATARAAGVDVAKKWLDGSAIIGAKTMRVNTGGPRIIPAATAQQGSYPKNDDVVKYLNNAIDSFKRMADHGGKAGVKVTIENHWGLSADPIHIRIILDEVNHPFCEASPDFCNWEHEYMLHHGLQSLLPYAKTTVHAKYWNRWNNFDIGRSVRVMTAGGFKGIFALEYEDGEWDGFDGAQYLMKEVMKAL